MNKDLITFGLGQPGPKRYQRTIQPNKPPISARKKPKPPSLAHSPNLKILLALKTLSLKKFGKTEVLFVAAWNRLNGFDTAILNCLNTFSTIR